MNTRLIIWNEVDLWVYQLTKNWHIGIPTHQIKTYMAVDLTCNPKVSVYDGLGRRLKSHLRKYPIMCIYIGFLEIDVIFMLLPLSGDSVPVHLSFLCLCCVILKCLRNPNAKIKVIMFQRHCFTATPECNTYCNQNPLQHNGCNKYCHSSRGWIKWIDYTRLH